MKRLTVSSAQVKFQDYSVLTKSKALLKMLKLCAPNTMVKTYTNPSLSGLRRT